MHEKAFIVGLSVLLLLTVGVLVYGLAPLVYELLRQCLRKRRPPRTIQHPRWGTLISEYDIWSGMVRQGGRDIPFLIGGPGDAPDPRLLEQLEKLLGRFEELERRALAFLREREPDLGDVRFKFYGLNLTDEHRPEDFTFEFLAHGDDSFVWRVDFVSGEPKYTGMDD